MSLEIIIGCMYSGKTSEIIRLHNKYSFLYNTIIINHKSDNRYNSGNVISTHNNIKLKAIKLEKLNDIEEDIYKKAQFIFIDEAHFFQDLHEFVIKSLNNEKNLVVVGLNGDCNLKPFMNLINLIPYANHVKHLTSLCHYCKTPTKGFIHYRLDKTNNKKISVGGITEYIILCRKHYSSLSDSSESSPEELS
jgi:thymidine kinase